MLYNMEKNPKDVSSMFNRISPQYDRANRILSLGLDMRWRKQLANFLPHRKNLSLLDLATGTGDQILALLHQQAPLNEVVGLDFSQGMLDIAARKLRSYPNVSLLHGNAESLPFPDYSFDVCTFSFGIRNVSNPLKALSEMARVTKPGGRCLILEFSLPDNFFRKPYVFYLRHLLPFLGGWIAKDFAAYRYLNRTIEAFPSGNSFLAWMQQSGFSSARTIPLLFGCVSLYVGET